MCDLYGFGGDGWTELSGKVVSGWMGDGEKKREARGRRKVADGQLIRGNIALRIMEVCQPRRSILMKG